MSKRKQRNNATHTGKHFRYAAFVNFLRIMSFLLPLPVYIIITIFIFPSPNSGFLLMGIAGTFFIGLGLLNIVGVLDGLYLGTLLTTIFLGIGSTLIGISSYIMYTPTIYAQLNEIHVTYYFLLWAFLFSLTVCYSFFRMASTQALKETGLSKQAQKKFMKGSVNYWLYKSLHEEGYIGGEYYLNRCFVLLFISVFLVHLLFGWYYPVSYVTTILFCGTSIIGSAMWVSLLLKHKQLAFPHSLQFIGVFFPFLMCLVLTIYISRM